MKCMEALLTVAEVAAYLNVSHKTVYRLIHRGRLPSLRSSAHAHHRVRQADVDLLLSAP